MPFEATFNAAERKKKEKRNCWFKDTIENQYDGNGEDKKKVRWELVRSKKVMEVWKLKPYDL